MHPVQQFLFSWMTVSCLYSSTTIAYDRRVTPNAHHIVRDPKTGLITMFKCDYPERDNCVMPYRGSDTTYAPSFTCPPTHPTTY